MEGGKVIASGTYGCIINPPLPCKGEIERPKNTVSKLMLDYNAESEMDEINKIAKLTKSVSNHNNYYILNQIKICRPSKLNAKDLTDFNKKCNAMTRKSISAQNVNHPSVMRDLKILQLPDGGFDITHYFSEKTLAPALFVKINNALILLLKNGIVPLQSVGVLHQDIKGQNIVYSKKNGMAKVIDWGLATTIRGKRIPPHIRGWPIMFNQPFSNKVFDSVIQKLFFNMTNSLSFTLRLKAYYGSDLFSYVLPIVSKNLFNSIFTSEEKVKSIFGSLGHIPYLEMILKTVAEDKLANKSLEDDINNSSFKVVGVIVCRQIAAALLAYSIKDNRLGMFKENEYFNEVYRHNCDIYGFVSTYVEIILNNTLPRSLRKKAFNLYSKYCLTIQFAEIRMDVNELSQDLFDLNLDYFPTIKKPVVQQDALVFSWDENKRCPKGSRRDKKTRKCVSNKAKAKSTVVNKKTQTRRKRCPNGTRRNKKTGLCEDKK
jgi:serine/threonine protein kinase